MTDPQPNPRVSGRISPLAVIVVVILIGFVVVAFVKERGRRETPSGATAPVAAAPPTRMPQQPNLPNGLAPRAHTNDAAVAAPTGDEIGNPGRSGAGNSAR